MLKKASNSNSLLLQDTSEEMRVFQQVKDQPPLNQIDRLTKRLQHLNAFECRISPSPS
jgi:hypothetical protein